MSKRTLLFIVIGWVILTLSEYYLLSVAAVLFWLAFSFIFLIILVIEIIKLFKERKSLFKFRILKVIVFACLFYFTLNRWVVDGLIEKIDWKIFYNKRMEIVKQVKKNKLEPDSNGICKLPFEFPILSNGGNEIAINQNKKTDKVRIMFWVFRGIMVAPSTNLIYTNDIEEIKELNNKIKVDPKHNWKIQDNWYRTLE